MRLPERLVSAVQRAGSDEGTADVPRASPAPTSGAAPADGTLAAAVGAEPIHVEATLAPENDRLVPRGVQTAASWCWRVVVIVLVIALVGWLVHYLAEVVIPIAVAILLTALLAPVARRLRRWGLPRAIATLITVVGGIIVVAGSLTLIGTQIAGESDNVADQVVKGFDQIVALLKDSPFASYTTRLDDVVANLQKFLIDSRSTIATYAADIGARVGHFVAGLAITIFALFYFLADGRGIWTFVLRFFPRTARARVDSATLKGWVSLTSYVRATILVALADAVGVLISALILGVPLAPALAALVFIGAFVPIVGALVSGFVAVLVALVFLGLVKALIMLGCVILVMEVEGHLLQPFLLGRAVKLHPLAVLLAIAIGVIVGGVVGALMSVPLLAFAKTFITDVAEYGQHVVEPGAASDGSAA